MKEEIIYDGDFSQAKMEGECFWKTEDGSYYIGQIGDNKSNG